MMFLNVRLLWSKKLFIYIYGFFLFVYVIQHCFNCRPLNPTVSEDAGIEPRTIVTLETDALTTRLDLTHICGRSWIVPTFKIDKVT